MGARSVGAGLVGAAVGLACRPHQRIWQSGANEAAVCTPGRPAAHRRTRTAPVGCGGARGDGTARQRGNPRGLPARHASKPIDFVPFVVQRTRSRRSQSVCVRDPASAARRARASAMADKAADVEVRMSPWPLGTCRWPPPTRAGRLSATALALRRPHARPRRACNRELARPRRFPTGAASLTVCSLPPHAPHRGPCVRCSRAPASGRHPGPGSGFIARSGRSRVARRQIVAGGGSR
jgi:hypothetical protein